MAELEQLASGIYLEGLAIDLERSIVWYSDVVGGGIHGLTQDGTLRSFNIDRKWTGGLMVNEDGAVLSSGAGGIMWNRSDSGESGWLIQEIDGKPINGINEMSPDGAGGIYFGTLDLDNVIAGKATRPTAIYRLTVDGDVTLVADNIGFANGLMLSPDGKRFYCNDSFNCSWVFDVQPDGTFTNRRQLIDKKDADGMAMDADGNVWITGFASSDITRIEPDGSALPPFPTHAGAITQLRFGGADLRDLYLTTVPADGGQNLKDGVPLTAKNSHLCHTRADRPGHAVPPTRFSLR